MPEEYVTRRIALNEPTVRALIKGGEHGSLSSASAASTTLTLLAECPSKEVRDTIINSGMEGGMQEAWALLEQVAISLR